jgi:outer membrane lipoprotein-sorting protein
MNHRVLFSLALIISLLLSSVIVRADEYPSARDLVQKMMESLRKVDFQGKIVIISGFPEDSKIQEAVLIRKAPDKQLIRFISPREMKGLGMVTHGGRRWRILDENREERRRRRPMPPPPGRILGDLPLKNFRLLLNNYDVRVFNGGHIAGRRTYMIELEPKSTGRPSKKAWIDADIGVILKIEDYDPHRKLKGVVAFSEIKYNPDIDESIFQIPDKKDRERERPWEHDRREIWNQDKGEVNLKEIRKEVGMDLVIPDGKPTGFVLESVDAITIGERKNVHLKYTDGLAVVSVFQSQDGDLREQERRGGPPWRSDRVEKIDVEGIECEVIYKGYLPIFRWGYRDINFTLMGELAKDEMIKMISLFVKEEI